MGVCIAATVTVAKPPEEKLVPAAVVEDLNEDLKTAETNGRQFSHGGKICLLLLLFTVICFMHKKYFWDFISGYGSPYFGFGGILPISFYMLSSLIIIILYSEPILLSYH